MNLGRIFFIVIFITDSLLQDPLDGLKRYFTNNYISHNAPFPQNVNES